VARRNGRDLSSRRLRWDRHYSGVVKGSEVVVSEGRECGQSGDGVGGSERT
jgi:hypothetical protein